MERKVQPVSNRPKELLRPANNAFSGNQVAYQYANYLQHGMAILRARMQDTDVVPMVLWDAGQAMAPGEPPLFQPTCPPKG